MSMIEDFQRLEELILDASPSNLSDIRNQLARVREQVEAYQAASDKQDETLQRQVDRIVELEAEKEKLALKIQTLTGTLPEPRERVLIAVAQHRSPVTADEVAVRLGNLHLLQVEQILGELSKANLVHDHVILGGRQRKFSLASDGRALLIAQNRLGAVGVIKQEGPSFQGIESLGPPTYEAD